MADTQELTEATNAAGAWACFSRASICDVIGPTITSCTRNKRMLFNIGVVLQSGHRQERCLVGCSRALDGAASHLARHVSETQHERECDKGDEGQQYNQIASAELGSGPSSFSLMCCHIPKLCET